MRYTIGYCYYRVAGKNLRMPAIIREDQIVAHGDMRELSKAFALRLREHGVNQGSLISY